MEPETSGEAYTVLASYYDRLTQDVNYGKWADYIQRHFAKSKQPISSVLDLGCGTGSLACELAQRGYHVIGADLSTDMLSVAQEKCADLDVFLVSADMRRIRLPEPVDAALCCLDSLNYLMTPAGVQSTFQSVYQALVPGGLFLFDVKTPLAFTSAEGQINTDEDEDLYCIWQSELRRKQTVCTYQLDLFVREKGDLWRRMEEWHEEHLWLPEVLTQWLQQAGFQGISLYGCLTMGKPRDKDMRIFISARKDA